MPHRAKPFKTHAPFGIATKRFTNVGFHPNLDKSGAMKREITKLGPASFNPKRVQCSSKQGGISWTHKVELEEFSKFLGFRNAEILNQREFDRTMRGPGSTDLNENLFRRKSSSAKENVGFGSGPQIGKNIYGLQAPPPETYFRNISETFQPSKKTFSKLPTFEWDGCADRFKANRRNYHLPPNLYTLNDNKNTNDITKKVVSARGPYDFFTGPRDNTTIKNHFSPPAFRTPEYYYIKPSSLQYLLTNPSKTRTGLFLKGPRFSKKPTVRHMLNDLSLCYRNPEEPGPAHYHLNQDSIKKLPASKHPFDSSNVHARPPIDWRISPGAGRYNPKSAKCMRVKRPSWVFLSKADRDFFKVQNYSFFSS